MATKVRLVSLVTAMSIAFLSMVAPPSQADDRLAAPGAEQNQRTTVLAKPDYEAGELSRQSLKILDNGTVACGNLAWRGAIIGRVVEHVTFKAVKFGSCTYLGNHARLNTSSCHVVIAGGGLGKLTSRKGGRCDLRIEVPGCTVHLGNGPFLRLGYHNIGSPAETTALTEPMSIGGIAKGVACLSPGHSAIGQYSGSLRFSASRDNAKKPFTVIL